MKIKKILSVALVLCLMLGCMGITALAAEESESITPGQSVTLSVPVSGGYVDEYIFFSFTPDVSGEYLFSVSYDDSQETGLAIWLSVDDGSEYFSYGEPLMFSAEADISNSSSISEYISRLIYGLLFGDVGPALPVCNHKVDVFHLI